MNKIYAHTVIGSGEAIISKHVRSYANDPLVVKKTNAARVILTRIGFPVLPPTNLASL